MRARLDYIDNGSERSFELVDSAVLGRHRDCAVVLASDAVSRRHARIDSVDGAFVIRDLGSRNGIAVNGASITEPTELGDGDRITICDHELRFRREAPGTLALEVEMVDRALPENEIVSTLSVGQAAPASCQVDPSVALAAVLKVTRELGNHLSLDNVLPRVLEAAFDIYPHADHGVILLIDERGELAPVASKSRTGNDNGVQVSRTVVARAMEKREAILSANAAVDAQFDASVSLLAMPIRSLMCVPLLGRNDQPLGVIQLHSETHARFTDNCLDLLVAVASAAAIAVENAALHERALRQDRLEHDLRLARDVQRSFLPAGAPVRPGYRFFVHYEAALTVGGDYYGFVSVPGDRLGVAVGDVSGKGLSAALMMARLSSDVRFSLLHDQDPADALRSVDRSLSEAGLEDRFVTFVLMVLDPASHRVALANAGHQPPLLRRVDGGVEEVRGGRIGVPLNVSDDPALAAETSELELQAGETVLIYTDGLSEATNPGGDLFGDDRVREMLARSNGEPEAVGSELVRAAREWAAGRRQRDDMTVVCFGRE